MVSPGFHDRNVASLQESLDRATRSMQAAERKGASQSTIYQISEDIRSLTNAVETAKTIRDNYRSSNQ